MNKSYTFAIIALVVLGIGLYTVSSIRATNAKSDDQSALASNSDLAIAAKGTPENVTSDTTKKMEQTTDTRTAQKGDLVAVQYTGKLSDGTVFDSSIPRGQPIAFPLGAGAVIPGWEKGILGMKIGEKKTLTIKPEDGYGATGVRDPQTGNYVIPPNATLIFDVELVGIQR